MVNIPTEANISEDESSPHLFSIVSSPLAELDCGYTSEGAFEVEGYDEQPCAVKNFHHKFFNDFRREIDAYHALAGEQFALQFNAAFVGFHPIAEEPYGVIVTELFDRSFESFDEMDLGQRWVYT